MKLGQNIRALRDEFNWSREKLAEKASVSAETIGNCENGHKMPRYDTIEKIAGAFGVTASVLCSDNFNIVGVEMKAVVNG